MPTNAASTLSERLRAATAPLHQQVEGSVFVRSLLAGSLSPGGYTLLLRSLHVVYTALEDGLALHSLHPQIAPILDPSLPRRAALEQDLDVLHGPLWHRELAVMPTAQLIARRLDGLAADRPTSLLAHAYVRYLGDLSGGQLLRRAVVRFMNLAEGEGVSFYAFDRERPVALLARGLRNGLDGVPGACHDDIVAEALEAFRLHGELFADLAEAVQPLAEKLRMRP